MLSRGNFGFPLASSERGWSSDSNSRSKDDDKMDESALISDNGAKPKRKRPKFIRKVDCQVCGDIANDHIHYGAIACYSCRAFFRRGVNANSPYYCSQEKKCVVNKQTRKHCQYCRFQKCLAVGMKPSWVMTEDDKKEKREKAVIRRMTLEAKRAHKGSKKPGAVSTTPRLSEIDEHETKYDFGVRPPLSVSASPPSSSSSLTAYRSPKQELSSPKREPHSPGYYIKEEPMSPGGLPLHSMSLSEFNQPMTHESGYSSSGRSPGNILEDRPSSPEDDDVVGPCEKRYGAEAAPAAAAADLAMVENPDLNRDLVPLHAPVLPFSTEENQLIENLIKVELGTAEVIPLPVHVMQSLIQAARTGQAVPYQTTLDGYTVCMKRIIKYASQLDFFQSFSGSDQRSLLLANTDMLVNIKSARMLKPGVNLRDQLVFAVGDPQAAVHQLVPFIGSGNQPALAYKQIYQSPWASSADHEEKFQNMMKNIFDMKMDRTTTTLLGMMALFSVSHAELQERSRAMQNQEFFSQLLYRYLCSAIGKANAIQLLPRYMYLLSELEEMAQIMVTKRLLL